MAKLSKKQKAVREKIVPGKQYAIEEAVNILNSLPPAKFAESIDVAINLGVDARKSDQQVRGATTLPHGAGKTVRVAVFTQGANADAARTAGADIVGMEDLAEQVKGGNIDFDVVIASPDAMRVVGQLGQILGPRGLMPNPKTGTVTQDVARAVTEFKGGKVEYRTDRYGNVHVQLGKVSFSVEQIEANFRAVLDEIQRARPASAKGRYLRKISVSSTMGPGVKVDLNRLRPETV